MKRLSDSRPGWRYQEGSCPDGGGWAGQSGQDRRLFLPFLYFKKIAAHHEAAQLHQASRLMPPQAAAPNRIAAMSSSAPYLAISCLGAFRIPDLITELDQACMAVGYSSW